MTGRNQIREFVEELDGFSEEQQVATRTWHLPSHVVDDLRAFVIARSGTTKHIGAFCTEAMRHWMRDEPDDASHRTWAHLKCDYDYSDVDENVSEWSYRTHRDYSDTPKSEKTALGFSAPESFVDEFTKGLSKDDYGNELACAVEAELQKRAQIARMQDIIEEGDATRTDDEQVSDATAPSYAVTDDGDRANPTDISLDDPTATMEPSDVDDIATECDVDWSTRRGLLAALMRGDGQNYQKSTIRKYDEYHFDVSNRSFRKDFRALVEQAEKANDPLNVAPAQLVLDRIDHHDLTQAMGLTMRDQPVEFDPADLNWLDIRIHTMDDDEEAWTQFLDAVGDVVLELSEYQWNRGPSKVHRTFQGKRKQDAIEKMLPVVETIQSAANENAGAEQVNRVNGFVQRLESKLDDIDDDIDDRYEKCLEAGKTPKSKAFRQKAN